jgi:hypothetical protein
VTASWKRPDSNGRAVASMRPEERGVHQLRLLRRVGSEISTSGLPTTLEQMNAKAHPMDSFTTFLLCYCFARSCRFAGVWFLIERSCNEVNGYFMCSAGEEPSEFDARVAPPHVASFSAKCRAGIERRCRPFGDSRPAITAGESNATTCEFDASEIRLEIGADHEVEVLVGCVFVAVVKPKLRVQTVVIGPDFDAQIAVGAGSAKPVQPALAQPFLLLVRIAAIACPSAHPIAATTVAPVINALEIAAHVLLEKLPDLRPGHVGTAVAVVQS